MRPLACCDCGFESHRRRGCLSVVSVVPCQVEVSATGRSLVQRSPTDCGLSECDRESSITRRPWPTGVSVKWRKKYSSRRPLDLETRFRPQISLLTVLGEKCGDGRGSFIPVLPLLVSSQHSTHVIYSSNTEGKNCSNFTTSLNTIPLLLLYFYLYTLCFILRAVWTCIFLMRKCEMPIWCNKVILLMYSQLYMFPVHMPIIRSIRCCVAAYGFVHRVLDGWWSWEPLRRSCVRYGWCCATAPSAPYTRRTQRLTRPPPIQKFCSDNRMLQLNI